MFRNRTIPCRRRSSAGPDIQLGRGVCTTHFFPRETSMTNRHLAYLLATTLLAAPAFAQTSSSPSSPGSSGATGRRAGPALPRRPPRATTQDRSTTSQSTSPSTSGSTSGGAPRRAPRRPASPRLRASRRRPASQHDRPVYEPLVAVDHDAALQPGDFQPHDDRLERDQQGSPRAGREPDVGLRRPRHARLWREQRERRRHQRYSDRPAG